MKQKTQNNIYFFIVFLFLIYQELQFKINLMIFSYKF